MNTTPHPTVRVLLLASFVSAAACQTASPSGRGDEPVTAPKTTETPVQAVPMQSRSPAELQALARDPSWTIRLTAVEELAGRTPLSDASVAALVGACADTVPLVRRFAAGGLAAAPSPSGLTLLAVARLLKDPDVDPRQSAARTLGALAPHAPDDAVADLASMLVAAATDSDDSVRALVLEALGTLGPRGARRDPAVSKALGNALSDSSENVRATAVEAVGRLGAGIQGTVSLIEKALSDPAHTVRKMAVIALEKIGPAAAPATRALARQLRGSEIYLRVFAADALAAIGPGAKAALPELRAMVARGWAEIKDSPESEAAELPGAVARAIKSITAR
jgi:HEAT repeat protein